GAENLRRLEVGGNEDPGLEAFAGRVCGNGVGQIACGRTRDRVEAEGTSLGEGYGDDTILEAQRGQTYRVILDVEIACGSRSAQLRSQMRSIEQRRKADGQFRGVVLGEGQQLRVAPHVRRPLSDALTSDGCFQRVVIVSNFQGGETLIADGAGLVSP